MIRKAEIWRRRSSPHVTGKAVLSLVAAASRTSESARFVALETPSGVEVLLWVASVLVGIMAAEAGEIPAHEKAAARHQTDRLEAHYDRVQHLGRRRVIVRLSQSVALAAHFDLCLGREAPRVQNRTYHILLRTIRPDRFDMGPSRPVATIAGDAGEHAGEVRSGRAVLDASCVATKTAIDNIRALN